MENNMNFQEITEEEYNSIMFHYPPEVLYTEEEMDKLI